MSLTQGRILTGVRAVFSLNGVQVGYCTSVQIGETLDLEPIKTLGYIRTLEFAPTGYEASLSGEQFRIFGETIKSLGFFPKVGQTEEEHFTNILNSGDMTATLEDRKTNQPFATVEGVKITSHNYTVNARGVVGEQIQFVCTVIRDESES